MKLGDRVIATFPDGEQSDVGEIIDDSVFRNGKAAFKIRYQDFDNWIPAEWLRPHISAVKSDR